MRIYTMDECELMLERGRYYWEGGASVLQLMLPCPGGKPDPVPVDDTVNQRYNHNPVVIEESIFEAAENYPASRPLLENLEIYLVPRPPHHVFGVHQNAEQRGNRLLFYARGTQIPHLFTAYLSVHEFGHYVQQMMCPQRLPDSGETNPDWLRYLDMHAFHHRHRVTVVTGSITEKMWERTIDNFEGDGFSWHQRPIEWWTEEFRYLFGGPRAKQDYWGLEIPAPGEGVRNFMLDLADKTPVAMRREGGGLR